MKEPVTQSTMGIKHVMWELINFLPINLKP